MTIDERLDRLIERHEALTQTVEIIASMQRENEKRFAESERRFGKLTDLFGGLLEIVKQNEILEDRPPS
jgi:hypothetical protein